MKRQIAIGLLSLLPLSASALEITASGGYADNPFEQELDHEGSLFTALNIRHAGSTEGKSHLQYSFDVAAENHELSDADMVDARARARWVARGKLFGRSASLLFTGDLTAKRMTYVDQLTGEVARTSRGDEIGERYSYNAGKVSVEGIYRFNKFNSLSLYAYTSDRDYIEDYSDLNIESIDFSETGLQPSYRYKTESGLYIRAMLFHKVRRYKGLFNDELNGRNVDSLVDYTMDGFTFSISRPLSDTSSISGYFQGYLAKDNHEGARDLEFLKAEATYRKQFQKGGTLDLQVSAFDREFREERIGRNDPAVREQGKQRTGYGFALRYEQPFKSEELTWFCSLEQVWVDNSDKFRSYDAMTTVIGLTYRW